MACKFKPAYLLIAFQQQMAIITIHMHKNDGLEEKKKKNFCIFTSGRFCLTPGSGGVGPHFREAPGWSGRVHMYVLLVLR